MNSRVISVIIPTLCSAARSHVLKRAIESVVAQGELVKEIVVVANGSKVDDETKNWVAAQPLVRLHHLPVPSLPAAIRHGRGMVAAPFFTFLDDDDVYLPRALTRRLEEMERTAADVVATNGFMENGEVAFPLGAMVNSNPLLALTQFNWLPSCGGMYRTSSIAESYFDATSRYLEWTLLAFRIAKAGLKIRFLDEPTFQLSAQPDSLWRTPNVESVTHVVAATSYMAMHAPDDVKRKFNELRVRSLHLASTSHLAIGDLKTAWRYHLSCLAWGGFEFLPYTRHLLLR